MLDVARQPLWQQIIIFFHISSGTPRVVTATVAVLDVPPQGLSRNITTRRQVFGSERHVTKDTLLLPSETVQWSWVY